LGEKALDRNEQIKQNYPPTTTAALRESSQRRGINFCDKFTAAVVSVFPSKYRSERRKDQLEAVMRLLLIASIIFPQNTNDSLERWNDFLAPLFHVAVWNFPTAFRITSMQHNKSP
jgi:hypothetical protein